MREDEAFELFWDAYPRHTAKVVARRAFHRHVVHGTLPSQQVLFDAIARDKQSEQWQRGVIPHASTWLNQERWTDEPMRTLPSNITPRMRSMLQR